MRDFILGLLAGLALIAAMAVAEGRWDEIGSDFPGVIEREEALPGPWTGNEREVPDHAGRAATAL